MRTVNLYNNEGVLVTIINIRESGESPDAITWGIRIFLWNKDLLLYKEGLIVPAIIN